MNMVTSTDAPNTGHEEYTQATIIVKDGATEQSQTDTEHKQENWEENSQDDETHEDSQKDTETETTGDLLNIDEGEQNAHIERGVQSIFARKRLNKHVIKASK